MLSRVAESVYWLNRYIERAENVARFIDVNVHLTIGKDDSQIIDHWGPLISTTGDDVEFNKKYASDTSRENVLSFLLFDESYSNSVVSCVKLARENGRRIRQILPLVVWEQLNLFYHTVCDAASKRDFGRIQEFCEQVRLASHLLGGAEDATSAKDEGWNFARLGRMSERADKTSRIVDVQYFLLRPENPNVGSVHDVIRWTALLQSTSALMMYRREHGRIIPAQVAEFLVLDPIFSRSMYHCVLEAKRALSQLVPQTGGRTSPTMTRINQLLSRMERTHISQVIGKGIHEYIDHFQVQMNLIGETLSNEFFTWSEVDEAPLFSQQQQQPTG